MANTNPLRYRGYYYDYELELYYLQSRYYDPNTGRFINADDISMLGEYENALSYNMFTYCFNNPINHSDSSGYGPVGAVLSCLHFCGCWSGSHYCIGWLYWPLYWRSNSSCL